MKVKIDKKEKGRNKKLEIMFQSRFKKIQFEQNSYKKFGKFPSLQQFNRPSPQNIESRNKWKQNFANKLKNKSKVKSNRFFSNNKTEGISLNGTLYEKILFNIQAKKQEVSLSETRKNSNFYYQNIKLSSQPSTISLSKNQDLDKSIEGVLRKLKDQRIKNFQKKYQINQQSKNPKIKTQATDSSIQYEEFKFNFNSLLPVQIIKSSKVLSLKKPKFFEINQKRKYTGSLFN